MKDAKIRTFMKLAGQSSATEFREGSADERKLGAHLLLSEVLEYVVLGLGVIPEVNGQKILDPEAVSYSIKNAEVNHLEMLDGLSDVAYTMYWNSAAFGLRLEEAFNVVCDNNLSKFVRLENWREEERQLEEKEWDCGQDISWPPEVQRVEVKNVEDVFYAVGKDERGKVRKPSSFRSVDLNELIR